MVSRNWMRAALVLGVAGLLGACGSASTTPASPVGAGAASSTVALERTTDATRLDSVTRPTLVVFGASWCESCKREAPIVAALASREAAWMDLWVVVVDTTEAKAQEFAARYPKANRVSWDPELTFSDALGVDGTPSLIAVKPGGPAKPPIRHQIEDVQADIEMMRSGAAGPARTSPAASSEKAPVEQTVALMGTEISILVTRADREPAIAAIGEAFEEMRRIELKVSSWLDDTVITAINRSAGVDAIKVDDEVMGLLVRAKEVHGLTERRFDVTFRAAEGLWDFRKQPVKVPAKAEIDRVMKLVDSDALVLDRAGMTAFLKHPGMSIGLGAIAKGYAVDRAARVLRDRGIRHFVVNAGGDLYSAGRPTRATRWEVMVKHPRNDQRALAKIPVQNRAVATSGDYERFFEHDGVRYSHILDPTTGYPASDCQSVTLLAETAADADAFATGVFVLGPTRGLALVERLEGVEAFIIDAAGGYHISSGLRQPQG